MEKTVNEAGNDRGSVTVALPDKALAAARRDLILLRRRHGAKSPIGHRCSNLMEQMLNLESGGPAQQAALKRLIPQAMKELADLVSKGEL